MSWKRDLQLRDLEPDQPIEVTCKTCGHSHYEHPQELLERGGFEFSYLDEVEKALRCKRRGCAGHVRIALPAAHETEGFQGGLA